MSKISSIYRVGATYAKKKRTKGDKKARKRRKMPYAEFLHSDYWQEVRKAVLEREGHKCHLCQSTCFLQVHHVTYKHRGDELRHLETVTALCRRCHARTHGKLDGV